MSETDALVWIDCEMTGLDPAVDAMLEVAVLVTDAELNVLGDGVNIVISAPEAKLASMIPVVADMHTKSGLTDEVRASTITVEQAEQQVMAYVTQHTAPGKALLAGNTIGTDRVFLVRDMPTLIEYLHYRSIDVSTIKELARRWYPPVFRLAPEKKGSHRALGDIEESIRELRYYRTAIFVPPPGPTTDEAKAIAAAS